MQVTVTVTSILVYAALHFYSVVFVRDTTFAPLGLDLFPSHSVSVREGSIARWRSVKRIINLRWSGFTSPSFAVLVILMRQNRIISVEGE
jgi:hypothetical protein